MTAAAKRRGPRFLTVKLKIRRAGNYLSWSGPLGARDIVECFTAAGWLARIKSTVGKHVRRRLDITVQDATAFTTMLSKSKRMPCGLSNRNAKTNIIDMTPHSLLVGFLGTDKTVVRYLVSPS